MRRKSKWGGITLGQRTILICCPHASVPAIHITSKTDGCWSKSYIASWQPPALFVSDEMELEVVHSVIVSSSIPTGRNGKSMTAPL